FGVQLHRGFMDARCNDPLSWETLVAYWSAELGPEEEQQADLHLLGCATCTAESKRVASMISAIRAPRPALQVVAGDGKAGAAPPRRRRRVLGAAGGGLLAAAAVLLLFLLPRGAAVPSFRLPAPVRDAQDLVVSPPASAREVRLEPSLPDGVTANGARLRRVD